MKTNTLILIAVIIGFWFFFVKNQGLIKQPLNGMSTSLDTGIGPIPASGSNRTGHTTWAGNFSAWAIGNQGWLGNKIGDTLGVSGLGDKLSGVSNFIPKKVGSWIGSWFK